MKTEKKKENFLWELVALPEHQLLQGMVPSQMPNHRPGT